ncbi:hypothetical protein Patl1_33030 [Pistacia atlantica]|uniref:Uncharacterized protein n=1 Tax=Pistacia atlantica TaxID=434234 RepID=A0ACC1AR06_9ROSI|nr:hypothetical protein Patl1_33030 [Pistacia atlantica]
MGRVRGKGKKPTIIASREDYGSGEELEIPAFRRRGRPQKPLKDEVEEEEAEKMVEDGNDPKVSISSKDIGNQAAITNGRKRKKSTRAKEEKDTDKHDSSIGLKPSTDESMKSVGFRQKGSRRKSKPRRAAEAGVECK